MTAVADNNILGFYASFQSGETDQELIKQYLWGDAGLKERLKSLKWQEFGQDFHLILFEIYVKPIPYLRDALKEIGNYRRKEKSIGIPVILDQENFFSLTETDRHKFFHSTILKRLELLKEKVKRNKLDLDLEKLKTKADKLLLVK
ncbi:hypothetical protein GS399_15415 [Pedobacter sp. HMF7647]|uniref:Uncharacterized protein n=1 Tax=Hufsiella arboris TaxID=2695275 RepID=A0A7K1YCP8_9SPHI|nr:hypothetical protein [Hufsiella arboris]MXV52362.1 hypothetical protein [Hufsiella arboris]